MALIKCPECGKKVSDKSTACIHCGCPIENAVVENIGVAEQVPVNTEKATRNTEKKEKVKKVVDKAGLKKTAIIASSVVGAIVIIAILLFFLVLKPTYEDAAVIYNDAVVIYNERVAAYEEKSSQIATENQKLTAVIDELQSIVSSGEKPYDPNVIPAANTAINEGKIALTEIPKWEDKGVKAAEDYSIFQAGTMKKAAESVKAYTTELTGIIESMQVPDHTEVIELVNKGKEALEFSIKQMKQVTCPSESFVLERVTNIRDQAGMTDVIALTEDNDPENYIGKAGWYTAKIIFRHKDVEHYGLESGLLTLSEVGNPAGGCVEVYRTEEDAKRRADELKSQEGTARSPGARVICGTMVIRVSDDLKTSYQQELLTLITNEMLRIEQSEQSSHGNKKEDTPPTTTEPQKQDTTTTPSTNTTNPPTTQSPTNTNDAAIVVAKSYINAYECATPNALKNHMKSNGYSDAQINYAMNSGELDWTSDIKDIIWSYNSEAEEITVTNCIRCNRKFYGEYNSCQYLNCGGGVNWSYYHGYSRADTISKLLGVGFPKADVDATMQDYEYGEFIDEKDLSDCIKVTGKLCEHFWNPATCQELSSCPYCGETKGDYADHEYSNRKCIWCGKEKPWTPPKISCSSWVSLKELEDKAGYYIKTPGKTITIKDLNDSRVNFVLEGFPGGWSDGDTFELSCNGVTVHCKTDSDSNYVYEMIKLKYSDLVAIGLLS